MVTQVHTASQSKSSLGEGAVFSNLLCIISIANLVERTGALC